MEDNNKEVKNEFDEDEYVSVDEETIKKNCEDLEINTINDEEEKYDNVNIIEPEKEDKEKEKTILEKFIQNLMPDDDEENNEEKYVNFFSDLSQLTFDKLVSFKKGKN